MLDKPVEEIVYEGGKVVGVKSQGEVGAAIRYQVCPVHFHLLLSLHRWLGQRTSLETPPTLKIRSRRWGR